MIILLTLTKLPNKWNYVVFPLIKSKHKESECLFESSKSTKTDLYGPIVPIILGITNRHKYIILALSFIIS